MKITFILPEISGGGIATYYKNLIPALINAGHEINVILGDCKKDIGDLTFPGKLIQIIESDYKEGLSRYASSDLFPSIKHKLAVSYACYKKAAVIQSDVIEVTDYNLLFYCFLIDKIAPTVIRLAGSSGQLELHEQRDADHIESVFLLGLEKTLINQADYILGLSKLNVDYWNSQIAKKANLHLPFLNYDTPHPTPLNTETTQKKGIVVGRLQLWKGAVFLCEFYKKYPNDPEVDWIGDDNYYKNYETSMYAYLKETYPDIIGHKIHFKGKLPYLEAQQKITDAAFVLVPSTWDTFNFVLTEAMWKGKIVIGSTGAGSTELIDDAVNGFVFNGNDHESLNHAFGQYLSKSQLELTEIKGNAKAAIREKLNDVQLVSDRIQIYKDLSISNKEKNEDLLAIENAFNHIPSLPDLLHLLPVRTWALLLLKKISHWR